MDGFNFPMHILYHNYIFYFQFDNKITYIIVLLNVHLSISTIINIHFQNL